MGMTFNFDDEHVIDENCDVSMLNMLKKMMALDEELDPDKTYIVVPERVKKFISSFKIIKEEFGNTHDVKFEVRKDSHGGVYDVVIKGGQITLNDPAFFTENVLDNATTFSVEPYLDGSMSLSISFSGMTKRGD